MDRFPNLRSMLTDTKINNSPKGAKEEKLRAWAKSPSQTEIEKCERAERMVKQAIEEDPKLSKMDISVYAKGSYANRTNIPSDSDVDIAIVANQYFFNTYPDGMTNSDFNFSVADYSYHIFKEDIARAIEKKFGNREVTVGEKCVKVRSNSCRVDADVVPHFGHRRYLSDKSYSEGVAIRMPDGNTIYNWPQNDSDNAISKNEKTGKRYKALVRVLKNIKCEMKDEGYASAEKVPSYLIACLIWNTPNDLLSGDSYEQMTAGAIDYLIAKTATSESVKDWGEVNELKYLFRSSQSWKLNEVNQFLKDAKQFLLEM